MDWGRAPKRTSRAHQWPLHAVRLKWSQRFDMTGTLAGRCFCGTIRFRIIGEVREPCYCHCESCRRASGAACVAWGTTDVNAFTITEGALTVLWSSQNVKRGFCARCGSTLTYQHALRPAQIDFTLVSLEDPSKVAPKMHIWIRDKLPWEEIQDGLPQHETVAGATVT